MTRPGVLAQVCHLMTLNRPGFPGGNLGKVGVMEVKHPSSKRHPPRCQNGSSAWSISPSMRPASARECHVWPGQLGIGEQTLSNWV